MDKKDAFTWPWRGLCYKISFCFKIVHVLKTLFQQNFSSKNSLYLPPIWSKLSYFWKSLLKTNFEGPGNHYGIFRLFDFKISAPFLPIFSDLCRIYVFQSIVQKMQGFKNGFSTHNFRYFEACPIFSTQWHHK